MTDYATAVLRRGSAVLARRDGDTLRLPSAPLADPPEADAEPLASARRAAASVGVDDGLRHVRTGAPVRDGDDSYAPVLFDVEGRADADTDVADADTDAADADAADTADVDAGATDDSDDAEWVAPTALLHGASAPASWRCYERVAPTVRSIAADDEHGAAHLSVRALEVLRDRAALQVSEGDPDRGELTDLGARLLNARPSMAVLENRVNRALTAAIDDAAADRDDDASERDAGTADDERATDSVEADAEIAGAVEAAADAGIDRALRADADAAAAAADLIEGARVLTLSRSGTVLDALRSASLRGVYVAESRPSREGIGVAEALAASVDAPVTVHTDAAVAHVLATEDVDAVVVGADAVLPDCGVVNKTGTRTVALAAAREDVPVYVVAAADKITHRETVNLETGDAAAVYDGEAPLDVLNPTFDVTPGDLIAAVVTERGELDRDGVRDVADEHRGLTGWRDLSFR